MSAIEGCRTAALGGHVARCENPACGHTAIAYNSCRNRHCPKCQGSQAREWLEARKAELLEVPYFHVVFTLPPRIGAIAYQNKAVIYDLLFKASAETLLTIAADPKRLGVKIGFTSVLHTWGSRDDASSARAHDRAGRRHLARRIELDQQLGGLTCCPCRCCRGMFRGKMLAMLKAAHDAGRLQFFGPHADLADKAAFKAFLEPLYDTKWHVHAKRPFAGPEQVLAYLARYTHRVAISKQPADRRRREGRHVQVQGLPDRRTRPLQDHDRGAGRVHPPLHAARPAEGVPSHPALRPAGEQPHQGRDDGAGARADRAGGAATATSADEAGSGTCRHRGDRQAGPSLPVLWSPMVIIEMFEAGCDAAQQADRARDRDQDRHVMMPIAPSHPSLPIDRAAGSRPATMALGPITLRAYGKGLATPCKSAVLMPVWARNGCQRSPAAADAGFTGARCTDGASQIPIAPAEPGAPHPAPSFPGGFRTPARRARGDVRAGPASETRHTNGPRGHV